MANAAFALAALADELAPVAPSRTATRVVAGHVGRGLDRLACEHDAGLVLVGPGTRGPLSGDAARHLLRRCPHPVMVCPWPDAVIPLAGAAPPGRARGEAPRGSRPAG
jgi:nucleotide-binding universal stress UspA family protein